MLCEDHNPIAPGSATVGKYNNCHVIIVWYRFPADMILVDSIDMNGYKFI